MNDLISREEAIKSIRKLADLYPYKVIGDRESYTEYNRSWEDSTEMAECAILNLDSVEAIPIEWLKKFRNGLDSLSECKLMEAIDTIIDAYKAERKEE